VGSSKSREEFRCGAEKNPPWLGFEIKDVRPLVFPSEKLEAHEWIRRAREREIKKSGEHGFPNASGLDGGQDLSNTAPPTHPVHAIPSIP
jgi:hypothetical protein